MFECNSCRFPRMGLCRLLVVVAAVATVFCVQQLFSPRARVSFGTVTSRNIQVGRTDHSVYRQNSVLEEHLPTTTYTGSEHGILASGYSPVFDEERVDSGRKPHFVIHCGPMKTGTSSLQIDLMWRIQRFLEKDGWHYIGGKDPMEHIPMDDPEVFLEMFEKEAKELRKLNLNMIRSREQYSEIFYDHPWMYERLKEILSDDWDVLIVAGYRPYFEWLKSFWFQGMRLKYTDPAHPELRHQNPWTHKRTGKFQLVEPMFPTYFNFWKKKSRFTDSIVDLASLHFPVKVYDVYDTRSARTSFLCDIIGNENVPTACEESIRIDHEPAPQLVNVGDPDEVQYDAIALAAAHRGMVDMQKWDRVTIIDEITKRQEEDLRRSVLEFPYNCPTQQYMDEFWTMSRDFDVRFMPEKSTNDPDRLDKLHQKFLASMEAKKYCLVDVDAVLDEPEWKEFFRKFA